MTGLCVLVVGNLSDGFRFIGPFEDFQAAAEFSEGVDADNWVATLEGPGGTLIAAAPELLAALKNLTGPGGAIDKHHADFAWLRGLIAQAEGRLDETTPD